MAGANVQRKPTFLWQAALILLPVGVLSVVGWFSVRQDKILAEFDAKERAQAIADDLLPKIWNSLAADQTNDSTPAFEVDQDGRLISPPPFQKVPTPQPFDLSQLTPDQLRFWKQLEAASANRNMDSDEQTCSNFLALNPPENFAAVANYESGLRLMRENEFAEAAALFRKVVDQYPQALGESGLALCPLAQWKLCELSEIATNSTAMNLFELYSNFVFHPTPLTPLFLQRAGIEPLTSDGGNPKVDFGQRQWWQHAWAKQEVARELFSLASPTLRMNGANQSAPRQFWIVSPIPHAPGLASNWTHQHGNVRGTVFEQDQNWFAVRRDGTASNHWFDCHSEFEIGTRLTEVVGDSKQIPEYFGIGLELADKQIRSYAPDLRMWSYHIAGGGGKTSGREVRDVSETLATNILATAIRSERGAALARVSVYLTSPAKLYQRQRARAFWFGALVLASAMAALIGLLAAWRSFNRQQELVELKSNFVSSVSHELRAPIASVRLMAENLEREKIAEPQKQREYFAFIVQECRRLSSLIENVLDFSRIEQGRKQYDFDPTDLAALARETVRLMEPYAAEKGVRLEMVMNPSPGPSAPLSPSNGERDGVRGDFELNVDGRAVQQALVNLIDNAIKHSPKGETVRIGIDRNAGIPLASGRSLSGGTGALLFVEDHGPGIPPEEHEKIFERFYRRGSELRRETQGVGIGLSIVKHIVEAHGGRVRVESAVGKGSRFTIELPMNHRDIETRDEERD